MKKNFLLVILLSAGCFLLPEATSAQTIAGGGAFSLAICNNNSMMSWGDNLGGQLGIGLYSSIGKKSPVPINSLTGVTAIAAGEYNCIALKNNGTVWTWGRNNFGQLGNGTNASYISGVPTQISGLTDVTAIAAGQYHCIALKNNGTVWAWGYNVHGELGNVPYINRNVPIQINSLSGIIAIAGGAIHSLAIKNDGTVWSWGANNFGQLGNGNNTGSNVPVQVHGLTGIITIKAGGIHSLAIKNDGTCWAWGSNGFGTLGNGTNTSSNVPIQVSSLTGILEISTGFQNSFALKNDGTIWAWGYNADGQLGNGDNIDSNIPLQISSLSGITSIAGGDNHTLAMNNNGTVWAWGRNHYGQLGDGTTNSSNLPIQVIGLCQACAQPPVLAIANTTICANKTSSLSVTGIGTLSWYNQAIGGTYLGGGANYTTPILNTATTYYVQDSTCAASSTRKAVLVTVNPLPTVTTNASASTICAGSTVILTGGGASSYTWTGGVTNGLAFVPATTTTYTVTGKDWNNCTNTATKTINVSPLPTVVANASATTLCEGTMITLTGAGAIFYTWTGGVTDGLAFAPATSTTYVVTGTDGNNCSNTSTKTINVNPLPIVTAFASATSVCEGSMITLTGGGAASYVWTGGISDGIGFVPTTTTTYMVTGTDGNNCTNTATKTINLNPLPIVIVNASVTSVCEGTTIVLTGGGAYSYTWSDGISDGLGFTPATTTTYTVTGTDGNNCSNTATKTITVNPPPDVSTNLSGITISANQTGATYQWLNCNNGNSAITGATDQSYMALINGEYAVMVVMNGCADTSTCVNLNITGIDKIVEKNNQLIVFPNPNNGALIVQSTSEGDYSIRTELGQTVQLFKLNSANNYTVNIENLSAGIYFIVGFNNNQMISQRVVVTK